MRKLYWPCLLCATGFMAWAHVHTDEITVTFAFLIVLGGMLGVTFEKRFVTSWLVLGAAVPTMEILLHYSLVRAPYPAGSLRSIAVIVPVALMPPLTGVALGTWVRHLVRGTKTASQEHR